MRTPCPNPLERDDQGITRTPDLEMPARAPWNIHLQPVRRVQTGSHWAVQYQPVYPLLLVCLIVLPLDSGKIQHLSAPVIGQMQQIDDHKNADERHGSIKQYLITCLHSRTLNG